MTYIENIFLCLALPMLLSLLFTSGSPRRFSSWCWAWLPACFRLMSAAFSWGGTSAVP